MGCIAAVVRDVIQNGRQVGAMLDFTKNSNLPENAKIANIFC